MRISFTGTRQGMSPWQRQQFLFLLREIGGSMSTFSHGVCVGADVEAHAMVREVLGKRLFVAAFPSTAKTRASMPHEECQSWARPKPPLERDKDIVDFGKDLLVAAPLQMSEVLRSGTWSTVRYARRTRVPVKILWREQQ